ncbi:MAG: cation diffusion facilitator family transporter [Verrucomicrobiota bacterium]
MLTLWPMSMGSESLRVTWLGVWVNLALGGAKTVAGWFLGSKALVADGMHSLLDLLSDIAVLLGLVMARRPEDANHHFGHHKFASFAKLLIGSSLLVFSAALVVAAIFDFRSGVPVPKAGPGFVVILIAIITKELLFWKTRAVALRLKSSLLMANAMHHRSDSLSSLGVAIALLGVWLGGEEWAFLDALVTLGLSFYLIIGATRILKEAGADLVDAAPRREIIEDFCEHILTIPGARAYHDFRVRRVGDVYEVDLHLQVDPKITIERGHTISKEVKERMLAEHPEVTTVLIHIEPANEEHIKMRGISDAAPLN